MSPWPTIDVFNQAGAGDVVALLLTNTGRPWEPNRPEEIYLTKDGATKLRDALNEALS